MLELGLCIVTKGVVFLCYFLFLCTSSFLLMVFDYCCCYMCMSFVDVLGVVASGEAYLEWYDYWRVPHELLSLPLLMEKIGLCLSMRFA